jgi:hypothetical protein
MRGGGYVCVSDWPCAAGETPEEAAVRELWEELWDPFREADEASQRQVVAQSVRPESQHGGVTAALGESPLLGLEVLGSISEAPASES